MADEVKRFFADFQEAVAKIKEQTPSTLQLFSLLFTKVMNDGAIPLKEKELVAIPICLL
jgi:alkylhydroperoxidase/carboxymuconolactone decarboxylase family protein YurZ